MLTMVCRRAGSCLLLQGRNALLCPLQLLAEPVGLCFVLSNLLLHSLRCTYPPLQILQFF